MTAARTELGLDTPKSLRARFDLSQAELSQHSGVPLRTVAQMERGFDTRMGSIRAVAHVLGVETAQYVAAMERRAAQVKAAPLSRARAWKRIVARHELNGRKTG